MKKDGLVGIDFAEQCRQVGEQLEREHAQERRDERAPADPTHAYATVCFDATLGCWVAESVGALPVVGHLIARGRNREHALNELRLRRAWRLHQVTGITWDDARRHATRYVFTELSV